mmetsp:Transcript_29185/g.82315  ORF Transcript_29185/g.82315 Transcript_29185/m.82315 type:complete len:219 (-) Transcript_29185:230-886(-)
MWRRSGCWSWKGGPTSTEWTRMAARPCGLQLGKAMQRWPGCWWRAGRTSTGLRAAALSRPSGPQSDRAAWRWPGCCWAPALTSASVTAGVTHSSAWRLCMATRRWRCSSPTTGRILATKSTPAMRTMVALVLTIKVKTPMAMLRGSPTMKTSRRGGGCRAPSSDGCKGRAPGSLPPLLPCRPPTNALRPASQCGASTRRAGQLPHRAEDRQQMGLRQA